MEGPSNTPAENDRDPSLPELLSGGSDNEDNEDQVEEEEETDTEDEASRNPNPIGSSPSPTPSLRPKPQAQPQTPTCSSPGPKVKNLIAFFTPSPQPKTLSPSPSPTSVVENSANPPSQQGFRHRAPSGAPPQAQGAEGRTRAEWLRQQKDAAELAGELLKKASEIACKAEENARAPRGSMRDPATRIYASMKDRSKLGRPITGKKTGICAGLKRNCRELGAPVLRRDPTAFEKLHMISDLERRVKVAGVSKPKELCMASRKAFEATN